MYSSQNIIPKLQELTGTLSGFISAKKQNFDHQIIRNFLISYSQLLQVYRLQCACAVKIRSSNCAKCNLKILNQNLYQTIMLPCNPFHFFCSKPCFTQLVDDSTGGRLTDWNCVLCPVCFSQIPLNIIQDNYQQGGVFRKLLAQYADNLLIFNCEICMENFRISQGITLDCNHRFCRECLANLLQTKIAEGQVSQQDLSCPHDNTPIGYNIVSATVSPQMRERYENFAIKNFREEIEGAVFFECPGPDCQNKLWIDLNADQYIQEYKCDGCQTVRCPRCRDKSHKGNSCEAYAQWKRENGEGDDLFAQMIQQNRWVRCPRCQQVIERTTGCKFMACTSVQCRGKGYFCFDCKKPLNKDHEAHQCHPVP